MIELNQLKSDVNVELETLWGYNSSDPNSIDTYPGLEIPVIPDRVNVIIWENLLKCRNLVFEYIFRPDNYVEYLEDIVISNNEGYSDQINLISKMILHQLNTYIREILGFYGLKWIRDDEFYLSPLFSSDMLVELYPKFINIFANNEQDIMKILGLQDQKSIKERNEFCFVGFSIIMNPTPHLEPYEIEDRENDIELKDIQNEKVTFATIPESQKEFIPNPNQIIKFLIKIVIIILLYIASALNPSQLAITSFVGVLIGGIFSGINHWMLKSQKNMAQRIVTAFNWMWLMTILTYSIALLII